jgi:hypothetical protein
MGKKCIPGVICIENMTLFILIVITVIVWYLYSSSYKLSQKPADTKVIVINNETRQGQGHLGGIEPDLMNEPPQNDSYRGYASPRLVPVNVESRGPSPEFTQVGILTRVNGHDDLILPLMGRKLSSSRDKMQYYTMSNTGNLNTKLPVSRNGKSCTGEYGCDEISNGETVYVEGYSDTFKATVYENSRLNYIPYF